MRVAKSYSAKLKGGFIIRIVYDDTHQGEFIKLYCIFFDSLVAFDKTPQEFVEYFAGSDRVQCHKITQAFREFLSDRDFEIAVNNIDTSGIGNNQCKPVYYVGNSEEKQQVCGYASTSGIYNEAYFVLRDDQGKRIKSAPMYEFRTRRKGKRTI